MNLCDYGCGNEAFYILKNKKFCCSCNISQCEKIRQKKSNSLKGRRLSDETKEKISIKAKGRSSPRKGVSLNIEQRKKLSNSMKGRTAWNKGIHGRNRPFSIEIINYRYPLFSKIEELRYNPENPVAKEIQVKCKNHNCNKWFTPKYMQLYDRIRSIEKKGDDLNYFYCNDLCRDSCPLFKYRGAERKKININSSDYKVFREFVLERDNYECQYCGETAEHIHHEKPIKFYSLLSLDPDYTWSCCKKCHYEKGHKNECSTFELAKRNCF